jgi:hypothetical protein
MKDGATPSTTERRAIKFGGGFIFGLFAGCLVGAALTGGRFGSTVGVGVATGLVLGLLAAVVSDESYRRLYKWPWPGF